MKWALLKWPLYMRHFFLFKRAIQWELYKTNKGAWELVGNIFPNLRQAKIFMLVDISSRT